MAEFKLNRSVTVKLSQAAGRKLRGAAMLQLRTRLEKARDALVEKTKELIEDAIKSSLVYKGLAGAFQGPSSTGSDLQAEFGLSDADAQTALAEMMTILLSTINRKTVQILPGITSDAPAKLFFNGVLNSGDYEPKLKEGTNFSYESIPHIEDDYGFLEAGGEIPESNTIRWMEWLLEASESIIAQTVPSIVDYTISYNLSGKGRSVSRSGRALMIDEDTYEERGRGQNFPYEFPRIALPQVAGSKNFIEDIALSRTFRARVANVLEKTVLRILQRHQKLPARLGA